jgi:hypothetical protein
MNGQRQELQKALQNASQHGPLYDRVYWRCENGKGQHRHENLGRVRAPANVRTKRGR